jgi:hypothetical protein
VTPCRQVPTFRRNLLSPSSGGISFSKTLVYYIYDIQHHIPELLGLAQRYRSRLVLGRCRVRISAGILRILIFSGFLQYLQAKPRNITSIRPRTLRSTFITHHSDYLARYVVTDCEHGSEICGSVKGINMFLTG